MLKPPKVSKKEKVVVDPMTGRKTYVVKGKAINSSATSTYGAGTSSISKTVSKPHAPGSYGYAKGTSAVGPGPTKKERKVIDAKYANKTPSTADRMKQFNKDPNAKAAVDYMTTSKGYQPDPLKARGGSKGGAKVVVKKGTGVAPKKLKVRAKF